MKERSTSKEQLDDLDMQGEELHKALRSLSWINRWFGNNRSSVKAILAVHQKQKAPLHIIDLGCGSGDVSLAIAGALKDKGTPFSITAIDGNENILAYAREACRRIPEIKFVRSDILAPAYRIAPCDILFSSHFIYHFSEDTLAAFIQRNRSLVSTAFIFSELERSRWGLMLFKFFSFLLPISKMARMDGQLAIRRAFSKKEWITILLKAGITCFTIKRAPLFRLQLIIFPHKNNPCL